MPRYRLPVLLAIVCALCITAQRARAAAPDSPAGGNSAAQPGNPLWTIPLNALTATRERPLFVPSRRPAAMPTPAAIAVAPAPASPAPAEPEQLSLRLLGTIAGRESGIAICLNLANSDVIRVRTGESFEGWTLRSVRGREATFEKSSRQAVLTLPSPDDPQPQPAAPPQVAGAQPLPLSPTNTTPTAAASNARGGTWVDGDGNLIAPPRR